MQTQRIDSVWLALPLMAVMFTLSSAVATQAQQKMPESAGPGYRQRPFPPASNPEPCGYRARARYIRV
jgi:hypothetical protein